jgi:hypothetical protein
LPRTPSRPITRRRPGKILRSFQILRTTNTCDCLPIATKFPHSEHPTPVTSASRADSKSADDRNDGHNATRVGARTRDAKRSTRSEQARVSSRKPPALAAPRGPRSRGPGTRVAAAFPARRQRARFVGFFRANPRGRRSDAERERGVRRDLARRRRRPTSASSRDERVVPVERERRSVATNASRGSNVGGRARVRTRAIVVRFGFTRTPT